MKVKKEVKALAKIKLNSQGIQDLFLTDRERVVKDCLKLFQTDAATEIELDVVFKTKGKKKSYNKLGYFFSEVLPKVVAGLVDNGWNDMDDEIAYIFLCKRFFGLKITRNSKTGEEISEPITLSDVDDEQFGLFLNSTITFANTELFANIQTPEEYKQQNNFG